MEYTNDVIFKVHYKKDEIDRVTYGRYKKLKKLIKWMEKDEYFTLVMIVSSVVLAVDIMLVKQFIEILKLL